jgi:hypothetical protein
VQQLIRPHHHLHKAHELPAHPQTAQALQSQTPANVLPTEPVGEGEGQGEWGGGGLPEEGGGGGGRGKGHGGGGAEGGGEGEGQGAGGEGGRVVAMGFETRAVRLGRGVGAAGRRRKVRVVGDGVVC